MSRFNSSVGGYQRLHDENKAADAETLQISDSIIGHIVMIHCLLQDTLRSSEPIQKAPLDGTDLASALTLIQVTFDKASSLLLSFPSPRQQDIDHIFEDPEDSTWAYGTAHINLKEMSGSYLRWLLTTLENFHRVSMELYAELHAELHLSARERKWQAARVYCGLAKVTTLSPEGIMEDLFKITQEIRIFNDLFCALVTQALLKSSPSEILRNPDSTETMRAQYEHVGWTRRAVQSLYDTLSETWTCCEHNLHPVSISLDLDSASVGGDDPGSNFCYEVDTTTLKISRPYDILVDSASCEDCTSPSVDKTSAVKRASIESKIVKSGVQPQVLSMSEFLAGTAHTRYPRIRTPKRAESMDDIKPDWTSEADLWHYLHKLCGSIGSSRKKRYFDVGYLSIENSLKFVAYSLISRQGQGYRSHSLDDVLSRASRERRVISVEDRLRTARLLAIAVLRFRTTAWLSPVWSSRDVHFFALDEANNECSLKNPFLNIRPKAGTTWRALSEMKDSEATRLSLRCLGFVLIEIAFSTPWRELQLPETMTRNMVEQEVDFVNFVRLSETVARELGSRYAKVVQVCLYEGFGIHRLHSAEDIEFEKVIYEDVVKQLDACLSAALDQSGRIDFLTI